MKKNFVLTVLFVLPIVVYLFFASGINHFGKLPILTDTISDVTTFDSTVSLQDKITVLGFLGHDVDNKKGNAFNLNQKIYKRFYQFNDFQFVMLLPKGAKNKVIELKKELGNLTDITKWKFIYADDERIKAYFIGLKTNLSLDENLATPYVFIIDKDKNLRGRMEDEKIVYGFNTNSVGELNNMMVDDVKIILAEYRLALKKNNGRLEKVK